MNTRLSLLAPCLPLLVRFTTLPAVAQAPGAADPVSGTWTGDMAPYGAASRLPPSS